MNETDLLSYVLSLVVVAAGLEVELISNTPVLRHRLDLLDRQILPVRYSICFMSGNFAANSPIEIDLAGLLIDGLAHSRSTRQTWSSFHGGNGMLVLTRKMNEEIILDGNIRVRVLSVTGGRIRLGVVAPKCVAVHRSELNADRHWEQQSEQLSPAGDFEAA